MEFSDVVVVPLPARFSLVGAFTLAVVIASVMKAPADPFAELGPLGLFGVDKWIHVGSYALLTFLLAYAYLANRVRVLVLVATISVLLGVGVELIQGTVPWRTMEFADVLANSVGTVIALALWRVSWRRPSIETAEQPGG